MAATSSASPSMCLHPNSSSPTITVLLSQFQTHHHGTPNFVSFKSPVTQISFQSPNVRSSRRPLQRAFASISGQTQGTFDPELRYVLELATDSELYELERILFGTSYFSPLLKSVIKRSGVDYYMIKEDPQERDDFIAMLESRFLFLAADARSTLRGWRPSYRKVLLGAREKLNIHCSTKLSTEDLEAEIFLHLLQEYPSSVEMSNDEHSQGSLELGFSPRKVQAVSAFRFGATELRRMILKGGSMLTLGELYRLLANKLSGKVVLEAANYQIKKEVIKKGGQLAALNLEKRVALLAAKQGVAGAAARYVGLRSMVVLIGPVLWGTFLADVVIQMLGTDYARILRAIYAFAQIRITRTYKLSSDIS